MKLIFFFFIIPLSTFADCKLEWSEKNVTKGIELTMMKKGCAFPDGEKENCYQLKSRDGKEIGATVFRESVKASSYCLEGKEQDAFVSSSSPGPRAWIECAGTRKPSGIRLESPDKNLIKKCPFPFKENSL